MKQSQKAVFLAAGLVVIAGVSVAFALAKYRQSSHASYGYGYEYNPGWVRLSGRLAGVDPKHTPYVSNFINLSTKQKLDLRWLSANVNKCIGSWSPNVLPPTGSVILGPFGANKTLFITCYNNIGQVQDAFSVIVKTYGY